MPRPPILVGGASRSAVRRALRLSDGYFPVVRSIEAMEQQIAMLGTEAGREGRSLDGFPILALGWTNILGEPGRVDGERVTLTGTPEQVTADLFRLNELGLKHVGLSFRQASSEDDYRRQMRAAAREIMPALSRPAW